MRSVDPQFWYNLFHLSTRISYDPRGVDRYVLEKNDIKMNIIYNRIPGTVTFHAPGVFKLALEVSHPFFLEDSKNVRAKVKSFMYHGKSTRADFDDIVMRIVLATA